jgi:hypothetical protein
MEYFEQHLNESSEEEPHTTDTTYADDITSVGRTLEAVRDTYLELETEAAKVGLKNEQKKIYMSAAGNRTILDARQTVAFGDKNFKVVNEFVYLWIWKYCKYKCFCGHLTWHVTKN